MSKEMGFILAQSGCVVQTFGEPIEGWSDPTREIPEAYHAIYFMIQSIKSTAYCLERGKFLPEFYQDFMEISSPK